jgi:purine nucleoside permease
MKTSPGLFAVAGAFILASVTAVPRAQAAPPMPIRVVVVTTFEIGQDTGDMPGEFQTWVERYPFTSTIPFPQGYRTLRYNQADQVLAMVTGVGKSHAAASIMALGMDPRFDLSKAYWILAGIAGIDPAKGSAGSAAWANYVVDGDLAYEIDGERPFQQPVPTEQAIGGVQFYHLNEGLTGWAYHLTADTRLPDDSTLKTVRAGYPTYPNAQKPPFVLQGDTLTADRFWIGAKMTEWGRQWVAYWTKDKGSFVTSAEEDTARPREARRLFPSDGSAHGQRLHAATEGQECGTVPGERGAQRSVRVSRVPGGGLSCGQPGGEGACPTLGPLRRSSACVLI